MNITQAIDIIIETIETQPVAEWGRAMDFGDFPHNYFRNFGSVITNIFAFIFPGNIATPVIKVLANVILPYPENEWITEEYLPEIV